MSELVSIIVPSYNSKQFIAETIASVIAQTYSDWELLIVDDCSMDNSVEVIEEFVKEDERIRLLRNAKNSGAAASRNYALREANGKWIAFLDSDDKWLPDKLEKQITFMQETGASFSYTKYEQIDEGSQAIGIVVTGPGNLSKRVMRRCCYPGCLTVMYDAEKIGLIQIPDEIANGENDYALWLKVVKKATCYYLDEILSQYRIVSTSLSHRSSKWKIIKNHYKMYRLLENRNPFIAFFETLKNVYFTFIKKKKYVKKKQNEEQH